MFLGPDHMTLFISPYRGVELKSWSLVAGPPLKGPSWENRSTYYVYYSYGSDPQTWNFWIDFEVRANISDKLYILIFGSACREKFIVNFQNRL